MNKLNVCVSLCLFRVFLSVCFVKRNNSKKNINHINIKNEEKPEYKQPLCLYSSP